MNNNETLKSCPFCGSDSYTKYSTQDGYKRYYVLCKNIVNCGANNFVDIACYFAKQYEKTEQEAIKAWNTRI